MLLLTTSPLSIISLSSGVLYPLKNGSIFDCVASGTSMRALQQRKTSSEHGEFQEQFVIHYFKTRKFQTTSSNKSDSSTTTSITSVKNATSILKKSIEQPVLPTANNNVLTCQQDDDDDDDIYSPHDALQVPLCERFI